MSEPANRESEISIAMRSAVQQAIRVSGVNEQTEQATEWPVKNSVIGDLKRVLLPYFLIFLYLFFLLLFRVCQFHFTTSLFDVL